MAKGKMHFAKVGSSRRLQRVLEFLRSRGSAGATGFEVTRECNLNGTESLRELRANGFDIQCKRERTTQSDRQVHRYVLVESE